MLIYIHKSIRVNTIAPGRIVTETPLATPPSDEFGLGRSSELLVHSSLLGILEDIANDALSGLGKSSMLALREFSPGPVFGINGGAAGGGYV